MLHLLLLLTACSSVYRVPGPLASVGQDRTYVAKAPRPPKAPVARAPAVRAPVARAPASSGAGQQVADTACSLIGARAVVVSGVRYRFDCSGFVEASLAGAGLVFEGSAADLFATARARGVLHRRHRPEVGDVAFFDDTYDKDGDGRFDDPLTHVGVVTKVGADGTLELVHLGNSGITTLAMNLRQPDVHIDDAGRLLNDYLRAPSSKDGPRVHHLSGELWAAFGSLWRPEAVALRSDPDPTCPWPTDGIRTLVRSPDRLACR